MISKYLSSQIQSIARRLSLCKRKKSLIYWYFFICFWRFNEFSSNLICLTAGLAGLATVWCRSCDGPVQSGAGLATVRAGLFCTSRAKDLCAVRPKDTVCAQYYEQFIKDEKKILPFFYQSCNMPLIHETAVFCLTSSYGMRLWFMVKRMIILL